jgi:hypothetical protein
MSEEITMYEWEEYFTKLLEEQAESGSEKESGKV